MLLFPSGRFRVLCDALVVFMFAIGAIGCFTDLGAATAKSADGLVLMDVPGDWNIATPRDGAVVLLMTDSTSSATLTVFRESLGGASGSALRFLILKIENFEKSFEVAGQTDPVPILINGVEAARATLNAAIPQPDGNRLNGTFIFTCLSDAGSLYTIVASTTTADISTWESVLNDIAASLIIVSSGR